MERQEVGRGENEIDSMKITYLIHGAGYPLKS
jgi:hypothetical protein